MIYKPFGREIRLEEEFFDCADGKSDKSDDGDAYRADFDDGLEFFAAGFFGDAKDALAFDDELAKFADFSGKGRSDAFDLVQEAFWRGFRGLNVLFGRCLRVRFFCLRHFCFFLHFFVRFGRGRWLLFVHGVDF